MKFGNKEDLAKSLINQKWYSIEELELDQDWTSYQFVVHEWDWVCISDERFDAEDHEFVIKNLERNGFRPSEELIVKFGSYWLNMNLIPEDLVC